MNRVLVVVPCCVVIDTERVEEDLLSEFPSGAVLFACDGKGSEFSGHDWENYHAWRRILKTYRSSLVDDLARRQHAPMTDWFDREFFHVLRREKKTVWGEELHLYDQIGSTNDAALEAVSSKAVSGAVWIAREQTSGRGRRGNTWVAAPGDNLLLSGLLRYRGETERFMGLSLVVGLAVRRVVQDRLDAAGKPDTLAQIKWPNDVFVGDEKIAGVLVETRSGPSGELGTVMGVGLNVNTKSFPDDLPPATSLALLGVSEANRRLEIVAADFLAALEEKLGAFLQQDFSPFLPELVHTDYLHDKRIRVGKVEGVGSGFDTGGRLLVGTESGIVPIISGTVELLG